MSERRYLKRSPEEPLNWYRSFYEEHGRIPTNNESNNLGGPNWMQRKKLGGKLGIILKLGFTPENAPTSRVGITSHQVKLLSDSQLIDSLSQWVIREGFDEAPSAETGKKAFISGNPLVASVRTYERRYGYWDNALAETGHFKFKFGASDCVSAAYRAIKAYPDLGTREAIRRGSRKGITPMIKDTLDYYPSLRELSTNRLSWDRWQQPATKPKIRQNKISTISFGVLALATANGVIGDFEQAHEILHKEDRGPEFSRDLYSNLAPDHMSEKAGFVWAVDFIERAHQFAVDKKGDSRLSVKDLHIGAVSRRELVHPTFQPELAELKAA